MSGCVSSLSLGHQAGSIWVRGHIIISLRRAGCRGRMYIRVRLSGQDQKICRSKNLQIEIHADWERCRSKKCRSNAYCPTKAVESFKNVDIFPKKRYATQIQHHHYCFCHHLHYQVVDKYVQLIEIFGTQSNANCHLGT